MTLAKAMVRVLVLISMMNCALFASVYLQGSSATQAQQPNAPAAKQSTPAQSQQREADAANQSQPGIAQGLVHETREAAGEEKDETAEFKQSASVRLISKWTGLSLRHSYWLSALANFLIIVGAVVWAGQKYLPKMFRDRTAAIQMAMREAQKASEEARHRLAEIETRLMKLDVEIGMMRDAAEKEAAAEESRIQASAQEEARRIVESAEQEIAAAANAARRTLTAYAADLAVALAREQIHVDSTSDQALVRSFAGDLTAAPGGPGSSGDGAGKDGR